MAALALVAACRSPDGPASPSCELAVGARPPAWTGPEDSGVPVGATATFAMTDVVPGTSHYAARSVMTALAGATFDAACPVCALGLGGAAAQAHTKPLRSGAPAATFSA